MTNSNKTATSDIAALQQEALRASVSIIGGGVTGGAIFAEAVQYYRDILRDNLNAPPLTIRLYEAGGQFGFGVPYDLEYPIFRLNQPASRMSLYDDEPGHFISWLREWQRSKNIVETGHAREILRTAKEQGMSDAQIAYHHPEQYLLAHDWAADDFVPRAFFRLYLQDEFRRACETAEKINTELNREALRIETHNAYVNELDVNEDNTITVSATDCRNAGKITTGTDALVIATGHHKNTLFADFRDKPGYADTPFTLEEIVHAVGGRLRETDTAFIVGTSQSMLDALAGLDALGFKGKIYAASSDAVEPWPFAPDLHKMAREDYEFQHLTEDAVRGLLEKHGNDVPLIADGIRELIARELHSDKARREGARHVLTSFRARCEGDWEEIVTACPGLPDECNRLIDKFDSNHTYEGRFSTYKQFKDSGQLEILRGRASPLKASFNEETRTYSVVLDDRLTGESNTIETNMLFNCASMQRNPTVKDRKTALHDAIDPVSRSAIQAGLITVDDKGSLTPAEPYADGIIALAGPAQGSSWGIPFTRDTFDNIAHAAVKKALIRKLPATAPAALTPE